MGREEHLRIIEGFLGRECERTLACNSLKIRFGEKAPYIWIDPPWELWGSEELVTSSLDYSEDHGEFRNYCKKLDPLNKTKFMSFEHTSRNGLVLYFQHGFRLLVPTTLEAVESDDFYHHWYASE